MKPDDVTRNLSVEGVKFYKNVMTVMRTCREIPDDDKREIIEMVIDDEL